MQSPPRDDRQLVARRGFSVTPRVTPRAQRDGEDLARALLLVIAVLLLGGVIFLLTWDMPPPSQTIEEIVPDAQVPR